ncbi:MFS general substrate transporter [Microthyrium microscopicum]|uniref:MFS general substrate transporter n=1 Tax=Microthyrium microscopicum TaxID=703497 RepID=A0A6A6TZX6_9PEZI|nr:MFS general substrate transporter [Microthyrium microscopicum]
MPPSHSNRARRIPWKQLTLLVVVRLGEPIAYASVLPYLPAMILSFEGVKPADVGFWTGTAAAIFSLAECLTAIPWGGLSDRLGRKPVLLVGLFGTMLTSVLWGFSSSLPMALFVRAMSGAVNGNVGIVRTMVAELCPWKELQPRAFSIMPIVYTIGGVIGPSLGGALANPMNRPPTDRTDGPFLWRFPYVLPNLVIAAFFLGGIAIGILFLEESLESKKDKRDWGIELGRKVVALFQNSVIRAKSVIRGGPLYAPLPTSSEYDQSKKAEDIESPIEEPIRTKEPRLSYRSVLTKNTVLYLMSYTLLATHTAGFEQIVSVLLHHPRNGGVASDKTVFPFQFNRGFGLDTSKVGLMFSIQGVVSITVQFLVFPPAAKRFGTLKLMRFILAFQPIFYIIIPYTALIENLLLAEIAFISLWTLRSGMVIMAFPCSMILLANSTTSLRVLGTVNGIATATNAVGRAFGPTMSGGLFTWGVHNDRIIAPFVFLAILSFINLLPLLWAEEGDGFGDKEVVDVVGEGEDEQFLNGADEDEITLEQYPSEKV